MCIRDRGNTIFNKEKYDEGSKFSERELLSYSIVLMGATLDLADIGSVGIGVIIFIILYHQQIQLVTDLRLSLIHI